MLNIKHLRSVAASYRPQLVTSDVAVPSLAKYEAIRADHDKGNQRLIIDGGVLEHSNIDISWLPAAAQTYNVSADPKDYILVDIPIVTVDVPNRNMQAFPFEEVAYFDPEFGKQIYKTFIGKMAAMDHCFPAGTMVTMADGSRLPIEAVRVGQKVLSVEGNARTVTKLHRNGVKAVTQLHALSLAGVPSALSATENHPLKVCREQNVSSKTLEWLEVSEVRVGDFLCIPTSLSTDGFVLSRVDQIDRSVSFEEVFNLEVEDDHTYIANEFAVHNCNDDPLKAKGVHFDASMEYIPAYGVYKIRVLSGFDRTKDPWLCNQILTGKRTGYSMGSLVQAFLPLVAGTRVMTNRGLIPIENVVAGDIVETKGRPKRCGGSVFSGTKEVVTLSTRARIPITASVEHTFLKLNPDLTTSWVEAGNIQEGDRIAIRIKESEVWPEALDLSHYQSIYNEFDADGLLTCALCDKKFPQLHQHILKTHNVSTEEYKTIHLKRVLNGTQTSKVVKFPNKMTPELAALLGYYMSEGSFGESRAFVGFCGNDNKPDLWADYERCFFESFGTHPSAHSAKHAIQDFLEFLGVKVGYARDKHIPWSILQAPKECVAAFIRAYWEGDGTAVGDTLTFYSASQKLCEDVRLMLSKFGIAATGGISFTPAGSELPAGGFSSRDLLMHRVTICGTSIDRYIDQIGVTSMSRQGDINHYHTDRQRQISQIHTEIPYGLEVIHALYDAHKHGDRSTPNPYYKLPDGSVEKLKLYRVELKDNTTLSYSHFDKYEKLLPSVRKLNPEMAARFDKLLEERLWWVEVSKVEASPVLQPVYCIKDVEDEHNFVAEGYVVHNCSICGAADTNTNPCRHMDPRLGLSKGMMWDEARGGRATGSSAPSFSYNPDVSVASIDRTVIAAAANVKLIYQMCVGANFIELSSVADPADVSAVVDGSGIPFASSLPVWMG